MLSGEAVPYHADASDNSCPSSKSELVEEGGGTIALGTDGASESDCVMRWYDSCELKDWIPSFTITTTANACF